MYVYFVYTIGSTVWTMAITHIKQAHHIIVANRKTRGARHDPEGVEHGLPPSPSCCVKHRCIGSALRCHHPLHHQPAVVCFNVASLDMPTPIPFSAGLRCTEQREV